jgi:predicted MFS family arabinose efflux permease
MQNMNQRPAADAPSTIPPIVWVLTGCIGLIGSNSLALGPIAPSIAADLTTSVQTVMAASAGFGLGTALGALALGQLIDRVGPQRILVHVMLLMAAGFAVCGTSGVPAMLIGAQFAVGMAAGVALPALYTLAAVVAPPGRESRTLGIVLTGWTLSMVGGVPVSALIADNLGWRTFYFLLAGAALIAGGVLARGRAGSADGVSRPAPGGGRGTQSPLAALRVAGVLPLLAVGSCFMAAFYGVYAYLGDHFHEDLGVPVSGNGVATILYGLGFGGAVVLDRFVDAHIARRGLLPVLMAIVTLVYIMMMVFSESHAGLLGLMALWGLANHLGLNALIMRLTALDPSRRGAVMGLNSAVTYLALFAGTLAMGEVYAGAGFRPVVACGIGFMVAACAFALLAARRSPKLRPAAAPQ